MTRRTLLTWFAAIPVLGRFATQRYGYMDVERWHIEGHFGKRVFCDGVDITNRCFAFDDSAGKAWIYAHQPPRIRPGGGLFTDVLHGQIDVKP